MGGEIPPWTFYGGIKIMNIEDLKKRKALIETNLKVTNDRVKIDTENSLRLQGALMDMNEIIAEEEKELKEKKEDKVEKKKVK